MKNKNNLIIVIQPLLYIMILLLILIIAILFVIIARIKFGAAELYDDTLLYALFYKPFSSFVDPELMKKTDNIDILKAINLIYTDAINIQAHRPIKPYSQLIDSKVHYIVDESNAANTVRNAYLTNFVSDIMRKQIVRVASLSDATLLATSSVMYTNAQTQQPPRHPS